MRIRTRLEVNGTTPQILGLIADGSTLKLIPDTREMLHVDWELTRIPAPDPEWPEDVIQCEIWVVDSLGQVWSATLRATAEFLMRELAIANFEQRIRRWDESSKGWGYIAQGERIPLLSGVQFFSDDRSGRTFLIGDEMASVLFKYSEFAFDLFLVEEAKYLFGPSIIARVRQSAEFDPQQPLSEARYTHELPSMGFELTEFLSRFLFANGVVSRKTGTWSPTTFSQPLVFRKTDQTGPPQPTVVVYQGL